MKYLWNQVLEMIILLNILIRIMNYTNNFIDNLIMIGK